jgi:hypothetical protein
LSAPETLRFDVRFSPFHLVDADGDGAPEPGQLTLQGLTTTAATKHIAITGGTGRYQGAGGEATLVELGDGTGTLIIRLRR